MCRTPDGGWNDRRRALLGCTRPDLPPVDWDPDSGHTQAKLCFHMGRGPDRTWRPPGGGIASEDQWMRPPEDPRDGCPGGDQRSPLVFDLQSTYYRRRDQNGNRVPNPRFDRCTDDVILDAVMYLEQFEDLCLAQCEREEGAEIRRQAKSGKGGGT